MNWPEGLWSVNRKDYEVEDINVRKDRWGG